jgi:fructokinase
VGDDPLGREIIERLKALGVAVDAIELDSAAPTGTVTVTVAADGQPQFHIHENVAWDNLRGDAAGRLAASRADAICFGSLAQRSAPSRSTIRSLVALAPAAAWRIFDVNLRQHYYSSDVIAESLALSNALKVNDTELPRLAEMLGLPGDARSQIGTLAGRYNLRLVAYTRGERGSLLHAAGQWSDHPGLKTAVVDTVGAGDSFTAAMTLGLLAGWDLDRINEQANRVAAFVCSRAGATPALPDELRESFRLRE